MRRIRVEVTAEDIAKGERRSECRCPVARAINRKLRCRGTTVDGGRIHASKGGKLLVDSSFPNKVASFVIGFDSGDVVKPFAFTVSVRA